MSKPLEDAMKEFKTAYYLLLNDGVDLSNFIKSKNEDFKRGHVNEGNLEKTLNRLVDDLDNLTTKAVEARVAFMQLQWEKEREQSHSVSLDEIFKNHINGKPDVE
jgi:hypothetical protein